MPNRTDNTRLPGAIALNASLLFGLAQDAFERTKPAASDVEPDQRDALVAIVFSAATLEAFINEAIALASSLMQSWTQISAQVHGHKVTDPVVERFYTLLHEADDDRMALGLKYNLASIAFTGKPFVKGEQPYQDFELLITLRNWIVHLKSRDQFYVSGPATGEYIVEPPQIIKEAFRSRHLIDSTRTSKMSWTRQISTRACARWACNTASHMINHTIDLIPNPQPFQAALKFSYPGGFTRIEDRT